MSDDLMKALEEIEEALGDLRAWSSADGDLVVDHETVERKVRDPLLRVIADQQTARALPIRLDMRGMLNGHRRCK